MKFHSKDSEETLTRTESTERHYGVVYAGLVKKARASAIEKGKPLNEHELVEPGLVVDAFMEHRSSLTEHTDRQYKAALLHEFKTVGHPLSTQNWFAMERFLGIAFPETDALDYFKNNPLEDREKWISKHKEMLALRAAREDERRRARTKKNNAGQKAKKIPNTDIAQLLTALSNSKSKYAADTALWFQAAYITGLRPSEWATAVMESKEIDGKSQKILIVQNGKHTNKRSFGKTRTLILQDLDPVALNNVEFHLGSAQQEQSRGQFAAWYEACRNVLKLLARDLWKGRTTYPTLYTARHLFAANAKMKLTRKEVAALMGHGSEFTAGYHYARRSSSTGGMDVRPSDEDMNALTVRNGHTSQEPKTSAWLENKRAIQTQNSDDGKSPKKSGTA